VHVVAVEVLRHHPDQFVVRLGDEQVAHDVGFNIDNDADIGG
jgi:hypothetical protein